MVKLKNKLDKDYRFGSIFVPASGVSEDLPDDEAAKQVVIANGQLERVEEVSAPKVEEKIEEPVEETTTEEAEILEPKEKAYKCEKCNKTFDTEKGLEAHKRIKKHNS